MAYVVDGLSIYISHVSPDDGLSGPKHVVSGIIKAFVCLFDSNSSIFICEYDTLACFWCGNDTGVSNFG
jgi:hypothetical protein